MTTAKSMEEMREEKIADLSQKALVDWSARIDAKDQRAISDLHNCALERLSADEAKSIFITARTDAKAANEQFAAAVQSAMADACEVQAIKQVERMEARRAEEDRYARIERRAYDRHFGVSA